MRGTARKFAECTGNSISVVPYRVVFVSQLVSFRRWPIDSIFDCKLRECARALENRVRPRASVYIFLWIPWEEEHNNEEWFARYLYTFTCRHPSTLVLCLARFRLVDRKKFGGSGLSPSLLPLLLFSSIHSHPVRPLSSPRISRTLYTRLSWLDSEIIHSHSSGSERSSGVVQSITSEIYE